MWLVCAVIAAILWGLNYAIAEKLLQSISPISLLAFEMLIGTITFFIIAYFTDLKSNITVIFSHSNILLLTLAEIIIVLIANFLIVYSVKLKNGTIAGIVELIYPIFTILFTWLLFQTHHLSLQIILGGSLILIGVVIISL